MVLIPAFGGVGVAEAILIDAAVVRAMLMRATVKLLGDRNWYLPRWRDWIPQRALPSIQ